jgi:hypothetical protein
MTAHAGRIRFRPAPFPLLSRADRRRGFDRERTRDMRKALTQGEWADFAAFCEGATNSQLREIARKEDTAGRPQYGDIARHELARRAE